MFKVLCFNDFPNTPAQLGPSYLEVRTMGTIVGMRCDGIHVRRCNAHQQLPVCVCHLTIRFALGQGFQLQNLTLKKPGYYLLIHICYLDHGGMHSSRTWKNIIFVTSLVNVCTQPLRKCGCRIIGFFLCRLRT